MSQLALSTGRAFLAGGGQFTDLSFPLKMFNLLLVFLPALACIARDPNEGKEKVHTEATQQVNKAGGPTGSYLSDDVSIHAGLRTQKATHS